MPIYEYECPSCHHRFDKLMAISAPAPACPECGEAEVRKLVSAAAFQLKGGGWYRDHYGLKSGTSSSGKGASADGASGGGGASEGAAASSASE